jgi:hypothetical protein
MSMDVRVCMVRASDAERIKSDPAFAQATSDAGDGAESVVLGDRWETLHFALTGMAWRAGESSQEPLARAVLGAGGEAIPHTECGYGPGRLVGPAEVQAIAGAMRQLSTTLVAQRLLTAAGATPASMHEAELLIGDEFELYDDFKDLYLDAAEEGAALLFTFG